MKRGIVSGRIKKRRSFVRFIQGINLGRGARLSTPRSARGERRSPTGAHIQPSLGPIDTRVINSPDYLLGGGSQPAGDIISYKSLAGPFCILLIVCILWEKKLSPGLLSWWEIDIFWRSLARTMWGDKTYSCFKGVQPFFQRPLYCSSWPTWWVWISWGLFQHLNYKRFRMTPPLIDKR